MRSYRYVGPEEIRARAVEHHGGVIISTTAELLVWLHEHDRAATFVIDTKGQLCLVERRSEHVVCAGGAPVLAAGEVFSSYDSAAIQVTDISNYSTGYCPE